MRHDICLSGLLGIQLSLRKVVVFLDIYSLIFGYSMLDLIMLLFGVTYVILLTMKLIRVLIMHARLKLTLHHLRITLMLSQPYPIHSSL